MRAVVCQPNRRIALEELAEPGARPGEIVLRLLACGLCGTDLYKIANDAAVGRVLGHEVVGEVIDLGEGVETFEHGDRVVAPHHLACGTCRLCRAGTPTRCELFRRDQLEPGGFSERILVGAAATARSARRVPTDLATETAVFLEPGACVLRGIERSGLPRLARDGLPLSILVLGAGSMGLLHLLILRALWPAAEIVVSEPHPWRRAMASRLGADHAVDPERLAATFDDRGGGFDAAFDTVGAPALLAPTSRLLRSGGTLVLFAHFGEGDAGDVHQSLFREERRLVGTYSGALEEQDRVFRMLCDGRLDPRPLVTHHLPLDRFAEALELTRDPHSLKILIEPQ